MKRVLAPEKVWRFSTPYSPALQVGPWLFVSGQVAVNKDGELVGPGDLHVQTEFILETLGVYLEEAGGSLADIVEVTYYVRDMTQFKGLLDLRERFFGVEPQPAQTAVGVSGLADPDWLVEISATAYLGDSG